MSVNLIDVKKALRISHDEDDDLLTRLIGSATREALAFVDTDLLPVVPEESSEDPAVEIPEDLFNGIVLMVAADYDTDPEKRNAYRGAAEMLWTPYRKRFVL